MQPPGSPGPAYRVHASAKIMQLFLRLQRQAIREGRGDEVITAVRRIYEQLRDDPTTFGEPTYRLPALGLAVRTGSIRPLVVDFGVDEVRRLVFIKVVKLLAAPGS
jgi:hypothetical protein